ncbi:MAG: polysialyltransferase family glycosyltransferase [Tissierella sp.]|uniref:polysialyltransferase family glycosyltransferase n=1 Tax=Tissierella sp. TaxID=41274 RepID=UPI003F9DF21F
MKAFFCLTPYQILLAIHLRESMLKNKKVDIYILDHFDGAEEIARRIGKLDIFNDVIYVNCRVFSKSFNQNRSLKFFCRKISAYLKYKTISEKYFEFKNKEYDEVYFTNPAIIIQIAIRKLYDKNKDIKINLYEDGIGGYSSDIITNSIYKKIFNKTFGFDKTNDRYNNILVFKPNLYSGKTSIPIKKIPDIDKTNKYLVDILNKTFDYNNKYNIEQNLILLDQPFNNDKLNEKIKDIFEQFLNDDYIVKLHPRTQKSIYDGFEIYKTNSIPWEIICLNNNIEDKILISYLSTASFSSKLLFDKEPRLILLFNFII